MMKAMDPKLEAAARIGDVPFLRKALADSEARNDGHSYFLSSVTSASSGKNGNIFHLAAWDNHVEFFRIAMQGLCIPTNKLKIVQQLLCQREPSITWGIENSNPLHVAASRGHIEIVKLILGLYRSSLTFEDELSSSMKPWLGQDNCGSTPLLLALEQAREECALKLLTVDMEVQVNLNDHGGNSALYLAVKFGCPQVALQIFKSGHPNSFSGSKGRTPLHFMPKCSDDHEDICKLLVERHPQLIKAIAENGSTVLHKWLKIGDLWPFEYLLRNDDIASKCKKDLISLIDLATKKLDSPLLLALCDGNVKATRILVDGYEQERAKQTSNSLRNPVPWLRQNKHGKTPLDLAILEDQEDVALCFLSPDINSVLKGQYNPLFLAIENRRYKVAEGILAIQNQKGWSTGLSSSPGRNVLHDAAYYKEEVAIWLVKKLPSFISNNDENGKTPLDEASEAGANWLVEVMLKTTGSVVDLPSSQKNVIINNYLSVDPQHGNSSSHSFSSSSNTGGNTNTGSGTQLVGGISVENDLGINIHFT